MARMRRQYTCGSGERRRGVMGKRLLGVAAAGLLFAFVGSGCSSHKKGAESGAAGAGGVGEEGLGSGSSLEHVKHGQQPGEEGPLTDIHYAFDSYELDEPARTTLRENGNWLKDHPKTKVEVEGHCDER